MFDITKNKPRLILMYDAMHWCIDATDLDDWFVSCGRSSISSTYPGELVRRLAGRLINGRLVTLSDFHWIGVSAPYHCEHWHYSPKHQGQHKVLCKGARVVDNSSGAASAVQLMSCPPSRSTHSSCLESLYIESIWWALYLSAGVGEPQRMPPSSSPAPAAVLISNHYELLV